LKVSRAIAAGPVTAAWTDHLAYLVDPLLEGLVAAGRLHRDDDHGRGAVAGDQLGALVGVGLHGDHAEHLGRMPRSGHGVADPFHLAHVRRAQAARVTQDHDRRCPLLIGEHALHQVTRVHRVRRCGRIVGLTVVLDRRQLGRH
jgi:hypothetical protein